MGAAIVAAIAGLLGAALGYIGQSLRTRQEHRWAIEAVKREAYAEFLRSISASYAQAKSEAMSWQGRGSETKSPQAEGPQGPSQESHKAEEADLRAATARIVLLAEQDIYEEASGITEDAIKAHDKLRSGDPTAKGDVKAVNGRREALIVRFKEDLGIPSGRSAKAASSF